MRGKKVAIVGLGGTGSYLLDHLAKTCVEQIHLYDDDDFNTHNAYRSPGIPTREELNEQMSKTTIIGTILSSTKVLFRTK